MIGSVEALLFTTYSVITALLAVSAGIVAARSIRAGSITTNFAIAGLSLLMLPAFAAASVAHFPGYGIFEAAWILLPALSLACALANARLLRDLGFGGRILVSTTVIWNTLLTVVFTLRALSEIFFIELGIVSALPLSAMSLAQGVVGSEAAAGLPVWIWLPVLLPPKSEGGFALAARATGGLVACLIVGVVTLAVPPALELIGAAPEPESTTSPRGDIALSVRMRDSRWTERPRLPDALREFTRAEFEQDLELAKQLGVGEIELAIGADLIDDDACLARMEEAVRAVRTASLRVAIRVALPPPGSVPMHPRRFGELMQNAHWIVAERLRPDTLILFDRPYDEQTRWVAGNLDPKLWIEIIDAAARQITAGNPRQRCAVVLSPSNHRTRELWIELAKGKLVPDVRFWIEGNRVDGERASRACITLAGWLAEHPATVSVGIAASPPTPLTFGGRSAMGRYYERVFALASGQRTVSTLNLGNLRDGPCGLNGIYTNLGRPRPVHDALRELLTRLTTARPASPR